MIPIEAILKSFEPPNIIIENASKHCDIDINGIYTRRADVSNGKLEFIYHNVENNMVKLHCSERGNQYEIKYGSSATPIGYITENSEDGLSLTVSSDTSKQSGQIGGGSVCYSSGEFRRKSRQSWQDAVSANGLTQNHKITNAMFKDAYNSTSDQNIKDWLLGLASSVENIYLGTEEENKIDSAAELAIEEGTASKAQIKHKGKQIGMAVKDILSSLPDPDADKAIAHLLKSHVESTGRYRSTLPGDSNYKDVIAKIDLNALKDCPETTKVIKAARDVTKIPSNSMYAEMGDDGTVFAYGPKGGLQYINSNGNASYVSSSNFKSPNIDALSDGISSMNIKNSDKYDRKVSGLTNSGRNDLRTTVGRANETRERGSNTTFASNAFASNASASYTVPSNPSFGIYSGRTASMQGGLQYINSNGNASYVSSSNFKSPNIDALSGSISSMNINYSDRYDRKVSGLTNSGRNDLRTTVGRANEARKWK